MRMKISFSFFFFQAKIVQRLVENRTNERYSKPLRMTMHNLFWVLHGFYDAVDVSWWQRCNCNAIVIVFLFLFTKKCKLKLDENNGSLMTFESFFFLFFSSFDREIRDWRCFTIEKKSCIEWLRSPIVFLLELSDYVHTQA